MGALRRLATTVALALLLGACSSGPPVAPTSTSSPATTAAVTPTLEPEQDLVVAGRHLRARCAGSGRAVMLVSGYGGTMEQSWSGVQPALGSLGRVCAYDRLGIGQSDPPPDRQTIADMARTLEGVISALRLDRPVVVGHSLGGAVTATWAAQHGAEARAIVLLDPSPPGFQQVFDAMRPKPDPGNLAVDTLLRELAAFDDPRTNVESLDPTSWAAYARLGRIASPVHVIVRGRPPENPPGMDGAALEAAWLAGQRRLVALSEQGSITTAGSSGHFIAQDQPELVVTAVRAALAR